MASFGCSSRSPPVESRDHPTTRASTCRGPRALRTDGGAPLSGCPAAILTEDRTDGEPSRVI